MKRYVIVIAAIAAALATVALGSASGSPLTDLHGSVVAAVTA